MSTRHREPRKIQSSPRSRGKRWTKTKERGKGEREREGDTALRIDVRPMEHILQRFGHCRDETSGLAITEQGERCKWVYLLVFPSLFPPFLLLFKRGEELDGVLFFLFNSNKIYKNKGEKLN